MSNAKYGFRVDDTVKWSPAGRGSHIEHTGVITEVWGANASVQTERKHAKTGEPLKPKKFSPFLSGLILVNAAAKK